MPEFIENNFSQKQFAGKISNTAQMGGIETSVLDNGAGRGTRVAWINTGSGLRYKVVPDRAMDIADAFFNQHSIAWLSNKGITAPEPFSDKGIDWLRTFGGGLLATCGLSHVGGPEKDEFGERGLHGRISNEVAEIESIIQPEPLLGKMDMSITGRMRESSIFGPSLELKRTISSVLGQSSIRIHDEISNLGNLPAPHMLLYHFNFGWPLVDEGTELTWNGKMHMPGRENDHLIFNDRNNYKICPPPMEAHNGSGESVAFFDIEKDENGVCTCGMRNDKLGLSISMKFNKHQLPWLINWQHWGYGEYVTALEPGTHPPIGQSAARKQNNLIFIQPGETKTYEVQLEIINQSTIKNGK